MSAKKFIFLFFLSAVNLLTAQNPVTIKLTEKVGLPDVEFYDIIEDAEGFIWLAADKGLFRFDGKEYQSFTNPNKRGLSVFNLKEDNQKRVWCNTISGQFFYVKDNELVLFLDLKNELKGELADFIFTDNKLVIFGSSTILEIDLKTKEKKNIWSSINLSTKLIRSPYLFQNEIYFTVNNDVYKLSDDQTSQVTFNTIKDYAPNSTRKIFSFKNRLYLNVYEVNSNKNYLYSIRNGQLQSVILPEQLANHRFISISEHDNQLWFCTTKGLLATEMINEKLVVKNLFFEKDFITKMSVDSNKTIWLSTINTGVYIIPDLEIKVFEKVIPNNTISQIELINKNLLAIGTLDGNMYLKNLITNQLTPIELDKKSKISALLYLKEIEVLLISTDNNAYAYYFKTKKTVKSDQFTNAKDLKQIGTSNAFIYCGFDRCSVIELHNSQFKISKTLDYNRAYKAFYDGDSNQIYTTYIDRIVVYDGLENTKILKHNQKDIIANDVCKTADGTLWMATYDNGIFAFKNDVFLKKIDTSTRLYSNTIQKIKCDGNYLWIITDKGLQVYDAFSQKFNSALSSSNFITGNVKDIIFNENKVIFSTQEDLLIIDKNKKFKKYTPKPIRIKAVSVNENSVELKQSYSLPYDKNRIRIAFNVNGYFPKEELLFEYKMVGLQEEWIILDKSEDHIDFNGLPSGFYIFTIRVKTATSTNYLTTQVDFTINQPFWKKWWFILGLVLLSFGILILFYKNKLAIKERENELALKNVKFKNELANLKLENLKSQMNPHFIFNALNSIQEYIVLNQRHLASSYLVKFADLIRAYLDHSAKGFISVKEEIECLETYLELEKLRFEDKFSYKISTFEAFEDYKIPTMLIQPYVENAIKHGLLHKKENRKLSLTFDLMDDSKMLQCIVLDNGVGRAKSAMFRTSKHKSFATKATQNRLELLNFGKEVKIGVETEDLLNENNEACGTKVTIMIPILKK